MRQEKRLDPHRPKGSWLIVRIPSLPEQAFEAEILFQLLIRNAVDTVGEAFGA